MWSEDVAVSAQMHPWPYYFHLPIQAYWALPTFYALTMSWTTPKWEYQAEELQGFHGPDFQLTLKDCTWYPCHGWDESRSPCDTSRWRLPSFARGYNQETHSDLKLKEVTRVVGPQTYLYGALWIRRIPAEFYKHLQCKHEQLSSESYNNATLNWPNVPPHKVY